MNYIKQKKKDRKYEKMEAIREASPQAQKKKQFKKIEKQHNKQLSGKEKMITENKQKFTSTPAYICRWKHSPCSSTHPLPRVRQREFVCGATRGCHTELAFPAPLLPLPSFLPLYLRVRTGLHYGVYLPRLFSFTCLSKALEWPMLHNKRY